MARSNTPNIEEAFLKFAVVHSTALVYWSHVEARLFIIFGRLLRSRSRKAMSAVYHSVINVKTRLEMIDAAAKVTMHDAALLSDWGRLLDRIRERSSRRNDLAHFMLVQSRDGTPTTVLRSSIFDSRAGKEREYSIKQIKEISDSFVALKDDLDGFLKKLRALPPPSLDRLSQAQNRTRRAPTLPRRTRTRP